MDEKPQVERARLEANQEQLLASLRTQDIRACRILDIGCGAGHLHHRLLEEGAASVVGVELSADYLEQAKALAQALGHDDRVTYLTGDFAELAERIEPADVTILDRVVHCYHEPERLVRQSTARTRSLYALSFPRDRLRTRLMIGGLRPVARFFLPFRPRFSRPESIRAWVREAGFVRVSHNETEMWHTEVYVRQREGHEPQEAQEHVAETRQLHCAFLQH
jgi:magnesium-protoporphyrin O-methyltransferase